jgi:rod shape-determining protein MreC
LKERPRLAHRITAPVRGLTHRFAFLGLVLAALGLMMLGKADAVLVERLRVQVTDALAPVMEVLARPTAAIARVVDEARELADIRGENERLRTDRERLLGWQAAARRLEVENKVLRQLLGFVPEPDARFITARVIADTGGAFAHSLVLNAGSRAGVGKGQAVVTGEGMVGRIAAVGERSAWVLLITDLNSRIPVTIAPAGIRAILAGNNSDRPRLVHLPPGVAISPGDRVVTSGHGGAFPPGLPVGIVAAVSEAGIDVRPFMDRSRIEYVRVVDFGLQGILRRVPAVSPPNQGFDGP